MVLPTTIGIFISDFVFEIIVMERMVRILELYRDNDDPELRVLNGMSLETFSRQEKLQGLKNRNIDGLILCRLGLIDPRPEFLCRLLLYALELEEAEAKAEAADNAGPSKKRQKKVATVS